MKAADQSAPIIVSFHLQGTHFIAGTVLLILGYLVIVPLVLLLVSGFKVTGFVSDPGFTLEHFIRIYTDPYTLKLIKDTLIFAVGSTSVSLSLGTLFAWLTERTDLPLRLHCVATRSL